MRSLIVLLRRRLHCRQHAVVIPIVRGTMRPKGTPKHPTPGKNSGPDVLDMCKNNHWNTLLQVLWKHPSIAMKRLVMNNRITTTILHQLIYAKGHQESRAKLIRCILTNTPMAASIPNGFGSLPIHVIAQRNTNFSAATKEALIYDLLSAYPQSSVVAGGKGKRTPLHILFTDYVSLELASEMVRMGKSACFMKDKHGFLPIHIACSRHCSPDKLELLVEANPASLHEITNEGHTPLSLAESTATKSHPNYTLICSLKKELARTHMAHTYKYGQTEDGILVSPGVKHSASSACMMKSLPDVPVFDARLSPVDFFVTHALMNKCSADEERMLEGPPTQAVANLLMHLSHTEAHEI